VVNAAGSRLTTCRDDAIFKNSQNIVESGALGGSEPRFPNHSDGIVNGGCVDVTGGLMNVFVDQRSAEIVGAEVERHLTDFLAFGKPRGLNVRNIIEVDSGSGEHSQVS